MSRRQVKPRFVPAKRGTSRTKAEPSVSGLPLFPEPVAGESVEVVEPASLLDREWTERLASGQALCLSSSWRWDQALRLYGGLKRAVRGAREPRSFAEDLDLRRRRRELLSSLLVSIEAGAVRLKAAPSVGWLKPTYGTARLRIRFSDFLGLNGAWQWFVRGVRFPGLPESSHPLYGAYFPTRHEHLTLLDEWLSQWEERREARAAADVGCGAGVLSGYLLKHLREGCRLWATDTNLAAVESLRGDLARWRREGRVQVRQADLLEGLPDGLDLILFNPPWLPGRVGSALDAAIYYSSSLFERFFAQAHAALHRLGRLAVLFSTFAQEAGLTTVHPIRQEVGRAGRFGVECLKRARVAAPRRRLAPWLKEVRSRERVELWVLRRR